MQTYNVTSGSAGDAPELLGTTANAVPPAVPSTTTREVSPPTTEQKALAFVTAYHDAWSRENADAFVFMEKAYEETVEFYGKTTPKAAVIEEKRKFATRWPVRAYSVKPAQVVCSNTCKVDGVVEVSRPRVAKSPGFGRAASDTPETMAADSSWDDAASQACRSIW
ncbi:hypothetical protein ACDY97_26870 [Rhizobium mongolense]|uniref:hypothetical protein n=1 Tax=Rhizobium mongolense TaxID=57676 RepID=UPI0035580196